MSAKVADDVASPSENQIVDDEPGDEEHTEAVDEELKHCFGEYGQLAIVVLSIVVYLVSAIILYTGLEDWPVGDCIYFAIVVVTTVGYGDYLPTSDGAKLATVFLSVFALAIVFNAIDSVIQLCQNTALQVMKVTDDGLCVFNTDVLQRHRRQRCMLACLFYMSIVLTGTVVFALCIEWPEDSGNNWVNGFYLTVITITTIGFGDFSPDSDEMKSFGCLLMVVGIPASATFLSFLTNMVFGERQDRLRLKLLENNMTVTKFQDLNHFVEQLRSQGVGNYRGQGDKQVSRFEFLCFMLVKNKVLEIRNIKNVMKNFDGLDRSHSGFLGEEDVVRPRGLPDFGIGKKSAWT